MSNIVTRLLNESHHKPDILDCIANLSSDEVFTPPKLADRVLDMLPKEVWANPELTWLDPAVKTGVFLRQIAYRLMIGLRDVIPDEDERRRHIFTHMLHGIAITELTALMTRRSVYTSKNANGEKSIAPFTNPEGNITYQNRDHTFRGGKCSYCGLSEKEEQLASRDETREKHAYAFIHLTKEEAARMKFDVIVGNPPYQLNDGGGTGASAMPIYQHFVEQAKKLQPKYMSFIIPSRWFAGGKGLDKFRSDMLNDRHIKVLYDYPNAADCFPGVEIAGGVMYFIWDQSYDGDCEIHTIMNDEELPVRKRALNEFDVFVRNNQAVPILEKVRERHEETLDAYVTNRNPFGFAANFSDYDQVNNPDKVKIYVSSQTGDRKTGYIPRTWVTKSTHLIDAWKVLMPKAYRVGSVTEGGYINPIVAEPGSVCSETFLVLKTFNSQQEAERFASYIKTRFFRFLVSLRKISQNTTSSTYAFVPSLPMQDEWNDQKLYERYGIDEAEQIFIESMIREMA